jgi:uncharacterized protein
LESQGKHNRWLWHRCPCCPPNIGRMVAAIGTYMYGIADDAVAVHIYGESVLRFDIAGQPVRLTQGSRYPWDGAVTLSVVTEAPARFTLYLRIPGWSRQAKLAVNGVAIDLPSVTRDGYAAIARDWTNGDAVSLDLEMIVERAYANPRVRHDAGRVALTRGPLVYCFEGVDNSFSLSSASVPKDAQFVFAFEPDTLDGVVTLVAEASVESTTDWSNALYRREPPKTEPAPIRAVPYFAWDNRAPGEMLVWLREG